VKHSDRLTKLFARWAVSTFSVSLLLFVAAGTTRLPSLRNFLATFSAFQLATMLAIDPELVEERSSALATKGTSGRVFASLSFVATLVVAAIEVGRLHSLPSVPTQARQASLLFFAMALGLQMWAMVVNPFFSPEVRLQSERGHQLVLGGPYRMVRHPGYLAMLVAVPSSALAIGSWLALAPAATFCLTILKRVGMEEEFLLRNLAGYAEYVEKVRGRLLPRMEFRPQPRRDQYPHSASLPADRNQP
jgi:protein-S-isoprenylcysteine O-methyltransferase Ste14